MNIETSLHVEIEEELTALSAMKRGSEEYKTTVDGLSKLLDKAIDLEKLNIEVDARNEDRKFEKDCKLEQMAEDKKDRMIKNLLTAAGIVIPTIITVWGTVKSLKFEETGTVTTIMGRGFINKLLPRK